MRLEHNRHKDGSRVARPCSWKRVVKAKARPWFEKSIRARLAAPVNSAQ
jgi:hypothetical protein